MPHDRGQTGQDPEMDEGGFMRLSFKENDSLDDLEVEVRSASLDDQARSLIDTIQEFDRRWREQIAADRRSSLDQESSGDGDQRDGRILGTNGDTAVLLAPGDVARFFTRGKSVAAQTATGVWEVDQRIYELERRLPKNLFVRINQGELVNLDYVDHLDLSLTGTIGLVMTDGTRSFVSRRSLPAFKRALGI